MKSGSLFLLVVITTVLIITGCENPMTFKTIVHDDGKLDFTLTFEESDSVPPYQTIFGIQEDKNWDVTYEALPPKKLVYGREEKPKYKISYTKMFESSDEWNSELDTPSDTLFRIHSSFEKKFRWFYTYLRYGETFRHINRFNKVDYEDYFNQEDFQFIERLPAEGRSISKADSLFLERLNEKIYEHYVNMGLMEEEKYILSEMIKRDGIGNHWLDTLENNTKLVTEIVKEYQGDRGLSIKIADSLKIPLNHESAERSVKEITMDYYNRMDLMSFANDGKYNCSIEMPWELRQSNADSVAGNTLYWRPFVTKFLFKDYEMWAESRKMNVWAVLVSIGVVLFTLYLFVWKRI